MTRAHPGAVCSYASQSGHRGPSQDHHRHRKNRIVTGLLLVLTCLEINNHSTSNSGKAAPFLGFHGCLVELPADVEVAKYSLALTSYSPLRATLTGLLRLAVVSAHVLKNGTYCFSNKQSDRPACREACPIHFELKSAELAANLAFSLTDLPTERRTPLTSEMGSAQLALPR